MINDPNYNGSSNKKVYVGSDGGILYTDDILRTPQSPAWISLNHTLGITQFYGGAANSDGSTIIGGTQDNGTIRYLGNSEGWDTTLGGDGGFCAAGEAIFMERQQHMRFPTSGEVQTVAQQIDNT